MGLRVLIGLVAVSAISSADPREQFESKVRPVLAKNCFACHRQTAMGGLRLDSREAILKGGNSGPAVVPGKPDESLLMKVVDQTHERLKMPPVRQAEGRGDRRDSRVDRRRSVLADRSTRRRPRKSSEYVITPEQRAFWSFQPVKRPAVPEVKSAAANPIDNVHPRPAGSGRIQARASRGQANADPARHDRSDGLAADAGRSRCVSEGRVARRVCESGRPPACFAALWRAMGAVLAGRRALCRRQLSLDRRQAVSELVAISELGDPGVQQRHAVRQVREGADRGRSDRRAGGDGILCAQSGDAGRSRGCHHPRVSGADGRVRAMPRPQVRSDSDEGLLLAAVDLQQHAARRGSAGG